MLKKLRIIPAAIAVTAALMIAIALPDWNYARSFERIEPGVSRDAVVTVIGEPLARSDDCYVAQFVQFVKPPSWPHDLRVSYCAHWIGPGVAGRVYTVAFDLEEKVVGIAYGDS